MALFDLPLDELRRYRPDLAAPADLHEFWNDTLADTPSWEPTFEPHATGLTLLETHDVTFAGFGQTPIKAWLHLPAHRSGPLPGVVEYVGYGLGRGLPHEKTLWGLAGYAHLVMDVRGQGAAWSVGDTPDPQATGEPAHPGFMTSGVGDPAGYYYRRLITDAVRAVEVLRSHPDVIPERVAVSGISQGGGLALAVASLAGDGVAAVTADVPFLCDFPRAIELVDTHPYAEIAKYLRIHTDKTAQVLRTLSYFDAAILVRQATAPALFSVGIMDEICPPSTVYAAFNAYAGAKEIREYHFNGHEGGHASHDRVKLDWMRTTLS